MVSGILPAHILMKVCKENILQAPDGFQDSLGGDGHQLKNLIRQGCDRQSSDKLTQRSRSVAIPFAVFWPEDYVS